MRTTDSSWLLPPPHHLDGSWGRNARACGQVTGYVRCPQTPSKQHAWQIPARPFANYVLRSTEVKSDQDLLSSTQLIIVSLRFHHSFRGFRWLPYYMIYFLPFSLSDSFVNRSTYVNVKIFYLHIFCKHLKTWWSFLQELEDPFLSCCTRYSNTWKHTPQYRTPLKFFFSAVIRLQTTRIKRWPNLPHQYFLVVSSCWCENVDSDTP